MVTRKVGSVGHTMPDSLYNLGREIGELIGAVRQNNHAVNNLSMKVDAFANVAATQETMLEQSRLLVEEVRDLKTKVSTLETKQSERTGATNVLAIVFKSPALAWLLAAIAAVYAAIAAKVIH